MSLGYYLQPSAFSETNFFCPLYALWLSCKDQDKRPYLAGLSWRLDTIVSRADDWLLKTATLIKNERILMVLKTNLSYKCRFFYYTIYHGY